MSVVLRHTPQDRDEIPFSSERKCAQIHRPKIPNAKRARILEGISACRYAARLIVAICYKANIQDSNDDRADLIVRSTSMSRSTVLRLLGEVTNRVGADYILQLAYIYAGMGFDPTAIEGGEILRKLFGGGASAQNPDAHTVCSPGHRGRAPSLTVDR